MKKITFLIIATLVLATLTTNAKVWRVNNRPNVQADFTTLQAAITGASNGDTLFLEGSPTAYGNGTFDKKLIVYGPGYFLSENDTTQAYKTSAVVGQLIFNTGSQGSVITGMYINGGEFGSQQNWKVVAINIDSITIQRNYIFGYSTAGDTQTGSLIWIEGNKNDILIQQNWLETYINDYYSSLNGSASGVRVTGYLINSIIRNNFIRSRRLNSFGTNYSILVTSYNALNNLIVCNNVIWGHIQTYKTFLVNNILLADSYNNGQEDQTSNNLCNSTQFPAINYNQPNINMDNVFVDYDLYIDKGYFLKPNSPAKNAGINGGDCGVFSYDNQGVPYILSGMPEIPAIFGATMQTVGTAVLPVNIKAKSHN